MLSTLRTALPPKWSAWILRTHILSQDFHQRPPVLIYQFGKVGSSTIRVSLRRSPLKRPVYQVHHLSESGIGTYHEKYHKFPQSRNIGDCIAIGEALRAKLYDPEHSVPKLSVITITREPISAMLSAFFEGLNESRIAKFQRVDGSIDPDRVIASIHQRFRRFDESTNRICTWFDQELNTTLEIDVFAHSFDHKQPYHIIRANHIELLLLRLEDLNQIGATVLSEFLKLPAPLQLKTRNQRDRKQFSDLYTYVKENLNLPKAVCRKIYRSQYATHFYSQAERKAFVQKWSGT